MDYHLELVSSTDFEKIVNSICQKILGMGVITYSPGRDGGRDGKFTGTAQKFPSTEEMWKGKFIIQSKHTEDHKASCADKDFVRLITEIEIPKVKKLKDNNEIDNYLIFTNRKYAGETGERLLRTIVDLTGVENSIILGKETINDYLNQNREIVRQYRLGIHHLPFDFSEEEIRGIILAFKSQLPSIKNDIEDAVNKLKYGFEVIDKTLKNQINELTESYYQEEILSKSLMEFKKIELFLENPINSELKEYYFDTANELNQMITLKREEFDKFEELFVYIYQKICDGSSNLLGSKRHVTTFLHYMYYECLIGRK